MPHKADLAILQIAMEAQNHLLILFRGSFCGRSAWHVRFKLFTAFQLVAMNRSITSS